MNSATDVSASQSLLWFARHEMRLAWRDWAQMMAGGRTTRERMVTAGAIFLILLLHGLGYVMVKPMLANGADFGKETLVSLTCSLLLTFSMMLSQAIEQVTRAFYSRADLDLILSSPSRSKNLFAVRILSIALTGALMSAFLISPFINMAAVIDGPRWLSAYVMIFAMSALATGLSVAAAVWMFRLIGPQKTRFIAQIVAAVVGAILLIGIQAAAVMTAGNLSRVDVLRSKAVLDAAPEPASMFWTPAKALMGDASSAFLFVAACLVLLAAVIRLYAGSFGEHAILAASTAERNEHTSRPQRPFVSRSTAQTLRTKEWSLLKRDPWLLSQTLMQVLYLIPPALLLWKDAGANTSAPVILAPVLVMAFGQLAGGLSWLAISGEDAPDLLSTAPVSEKTLRRAKNEAVMTVLAVGATPFVLSLALMSGWGAACAAAGIAAASASAILIQLWFRAAAKRSQFRRRQTASRTATFSEALSSISWAGAASLAAMCSWFAIAFAVLALMALGVAKLLSPPGT